MLIIYLKSLCIYYRVIACTKITQEVLLLICRFIYFEIPMDLSIHKKKKNMQNSLNKYCRCLPVVHSFHFSTTAYLTTNAVCIDLPCSDTLLHDFIFYAHKMIAQTEMHRPHITHRNVTVFYRSMLNFTMHCNSETLGAPLGHHSILFYLPILIYVL